MAELPNKVVRLAKPQIGQEELLEIAKVLESGYLTQGPTVAAFENAVAEYTSCKFAFATTSATTALHLSLVVLGIGKDDEVLVPDFTFPATANVVIQQCAKPVLVDIDPRTFTIDVNDIRTKISPKTKCIMPVHTFGLPANMSEILSIAKEHNLTVLEDAACALGASFMGKPCGSLGDLACFSFHPRKIITTGEGGCITTNRADFVNRIQVLRSHGAIRDGYWCSFVSHGYNYRMSDILGAVGVVQMKKLKSIVSERRRLANLMSSALSEIPGLECPADPPWGTHTYQSYVVLLPEGSNQKDIVNYMRKNGIETTLGTYSLHAQPYFIKEYGYKENDLPVSYGVFKRSLTLPLYPQMESSIPHIVELLRDTLS